MLLRECCFTILIKSGKNYDFVDKYSLILALFSMKFMTYTNLTLPTPKGLRLVAKAYSNFIIAPSKNLKRVISIESLSKLAGKELIRTYNTPTE
jgi:hypothetical protein